jgi:hypothetical protein
MTLSVVMIATTTHAATSLRTTLSSHRAEVGEGIRVELTALSDQETPGSPRLRAPPGFSVQGPSVSSSQQISFSNGHFERRRGITATWVLVGTRPGHYVIGPATVEVGASVMQGETAAIEIVPPGTIPRPKPRSFFDPGSPFDPFSGMPRMPGFPGLGDPDDTPLLNAGPEAPAEYAVAHAPDELAFVRATVSPTTVVVGEQVTLRVYGYGSRGPYDEVGSSEPSRADFLSQVLVDTSFRQPRYIVDIDGTRWSAVKLREVALFPLHAGTLTIGGMRTGFRGPGYPETRPLQGLVRTGPELQVVVTEPPIAGRPPGYEIGDVGAYALSAEVEPRRVEAGDAVAATIRLEGTGSLPEHLKLPEQRGVEWLEPTITQAVTPNGPLIAGWRSFRYVVRLETAGTHDLGEVTLPFYDPRDHRYDVARVRLGTVEVTPGKDAPPTPAAGAPSAQPPPEALEGIGATRKKLGPTPVPPRHLADGPAFWAFLVGGPGGVAALGGLVELLRRLRTRLSARAGSRTALARRALQEAEAAALRRDGAAVAGAIERAVYATIEERFGLKARAVLRDSLVAELGRAGADSALARDVVEILGACDGLRFGEAPDAGAAGAVDRATSVVARLGRLGRASGTENPA